MYKKQIHNKTVQIKLILNVNPIQEGGVKGKKAPLPVFPL